MYGSTQVGAAFLAIIAILLSLFLLRAAVRDGAWKVFAVVLALFSVRELVQAANIFGIIANTSLAYYTTLVMMLLLGLSLVLRMFRQGGVRS